MNQQQVGRAASKGVTLPHITNVIQPKQNYKYYSVRSELLAITETENEAIVLDCLDKMTAAARNLGQSYGHDPNLGNGNIFPFSTTYETIQAWTMGTVSKQSIQTSMDNLEAKRYLYRYREGQNKEYVYVLDYETVNEDIQRLPSADRYVGGTGLRFVRPEDSWYYGMKSSRDGMKSSPDGMKSSREPLPSPYSVFKEEKQSLKEEPPPTPILLLPETSECRNPTESRTLTRRTPPECQESTNSIHPPPSPPLTNLNDDTIESCEDVLAVWSRVIRRPNKADREYILGKCEFVVGRPTSDVEQVFRNWKSWDVARSKKWPVRLFWSNPKPQFEMLEDSRMPETTRPLAAERFSDAQAPQHTSPPETNAQRADYVEIWNRLCPSSPTDDTIHRNRAFTECVRSSDFVEAFEEIAKLCEQGRKNTSRDMGWLNLPWLCRKQDGMAKPNWKRLLGGEIGVKNTAASVDVGKEPWYIRLMEEAAANEKKPKPEAKKKPVIADGGDSDDGAEYRKRKYSWWNDPRVLESSWGANRPKPFRLRDVQPNPALLELMQEFGCGEGGSQADHDAGGVVPGPGSDPQVSE